MSILQRRGPILVLLSLSICLGSVSAMAEGTYRKSPRIPPRHLESTSPLLVKTGAASAVNEPTAPEKARALSDSPAPAQSAAAEMTPEQGFVPTRFDSPSQPYIEESPDALPSDANSNAASAVESPAEPPSLGASQPAPAIEQPGTSSFQPAASEGEMQPGPEMQAEGTIPGMAQVDAPPGQAQSDPPSAPATSAVANPVTPPADSKTRPKASKTAVLPEKSKEKHPVVKEVIPIVPDTPVPAEWTKRPEKPAAKAGKAKASAQKPPRGTEKSPNPNLDSTAEPTPAPAPSTTQNTVAPASSLGTPADQQRLQTENATISKPNPVESGMQPEAIQSQPAPPPQNPGAVTQAAPPATSVDAPLGSPGTTPMGTTPIGTTMAGQVQYTESPPEAQNLPPDTLPPLQVSDPEPEPLPSDIGQTDRAIQSLPALSTVQSPLQKPAEPPKTGASANKPAPAGKPTAGQPKMVVQFPVDAPKPDVTSRKAASKDPVSGPRRPVYLYPRGYKPYLPSLNAQHRQWHEQAIHHYNKANQLGRRNKVTEAIVEYRRAIVLSPDFADAYVGLSSAYMLKNDWENVFELAEKALNLKKGFVDPANIAQAQYNLAVAHCAADDASHAKWYLKANQKTGHPLTRELQRFMQHTCKP